MARRSKPAFVFHDLGQAKAAVSAARAANRPIVLITERAAGCYGGPGLYLEIFRQAEGADGDDLAELIIDCGDDAAVAVEALAEGARAVILRGSRAAFARVRAIAAAQGARLLRRRPAAHELLPNADPAAICRTVIAAC